MNKSIAFLLSILFLLAACSSPDRNELFNNIKEAEANLFDKNESFKFDEALAQKAIDAYSEFSENFPKDPETPGILFKEADLHRAMKNHDEALDIYRKIEKEYADHNKAPHSLFLQGFVYENEMNDLENAEKRYQAFLEKYPDHDLAEDVEFSLKNLGKTPEEIIQEFNQRQNTAAQDSLL